MKESSYFSWGWSISVVKQSVNIWSSIVVGNGRVSRIFRMRIWMRLKLSDWEVRILL